jgi:hypothetical protein
VRLAGVAALAELRALAMLASMDVCNKLQA